MVFFVVIITIIIIMIFSNKDKRGLFFILSLIPITLMVFNINNPDKQNYMILYEDISSGQFHDNAEIGMQLIIYVMTKLNIRFEIFINVFYMVALLLIVRFMIQWSNRPSLVILLYIIYPLFLDIVQIRTLMASAIALNALNYLKERNKINILKYTLLILIAASIHNSAYFYLLFLFAFFSSKIIAILASSALVLFIVMQTFLLDYIREHFLFLVNQLNRYTSQNISETSVFVLIVSYIVNIATCLLYNEYIIKNNYPNTQKKDGEIILKINIISICLIPFTLLALEFMRLYRMVMIINYTLAGNMFAYNQKTHKYKVMPLIIIMMIIVSSMFSFYRYIYIDHLDDVYRYLFTHNTFWNLFYN